MFAPHLALLILAGATPFLAFADNSFGFGAVAFYVAIVLAAIGISVRAGEAAHIVSIIRAPAALALLPFLWFIVQLLPFPLGGLTASIWQSTADVLASPVLSHATIDPGATFLALSRFVMLTTVIFLAAALTIERQHAQQLFLLLGAIASAFALMLVIDCVGSLQFLDTAGTGGAHAVFVSGAAYGLVLWSAVVVMLLERQQKRRGWRERWERLALPLLGALVLTLLSFAAMLLDAARYAIFASTCGLFAVAGLYFVRRIGLGFRAALVLGLVGTLGALAVVWSKAQPIPETGIAVRYAAHASPELIAPANRVATEVGPTGSGAGTFGAIYRVYGTTRSPGTSMSPATFASQVAVEMGRYALWTFALVGCALILLCARGVFDRGRDFFYPLAGTGIGVVALLTAFCDPSLANLGLSIFVASALGLALGQTAGRSLS